MKKATFLIILSLLILFVPLTSSAAGLVPCDGANCQISDFFEMLAQIYSFIVLQIATPLAIIAIIIGAIFMIISAGNPNLHGIGKKILWTAIIGLVLVFCSYLIIDFVLVAIGFRGNWSNPF